MSPKKPHSYYDLDNGRPLAQQWGHRDVSLFEEDRMSNDCSDSNTFSGNSSHLGSVVCNKLESSFSIYKAYSWECGDMYQRECNIPEPYYSHSPLSMCVNSEEMINLGMCNGEAHLFLKTPPEHRFRYRYDTEMSGTHGSLQGIRSGSEKSVPEVELVNYPHEALIRVSLVTCNEVGERYPHPHNLFIKEKMYEKKMYENLHKKSLTKTGHYSDPHYIRVGKNGRDHVARFEGMCIISSKKENFSASIREKLHMRDIEHGAGTIEEEEFSKKVDEALKLVDLDFVSLCFEAFRQEGERLVPICAPLYSEPIGNAKSANTGKLKISRINKCSGSCKGGDEIWLLVEKINKKGLVIRFFEECDGNVIWESRIEGDDIILHHQYAIIFKTPAYRDPNITSEVKVLMRLERSSQLSQASNCSEPITFVYEPPKPRNHRNENLYKKESILSSNKQTHIKRPRTDLSVLPPINIQYKRKKDEQECSNTILDETDLDHILSDDCMNSPHLTQLIMGFDVEDVLQFFSDDSEMPLQKDSISPAAKSGRDLKQKLQLMYSKFDESEIKKLTDRINNIKVSKGKSKPDKGCGDDEKDVEDAVSSLLSLREKAVDIRNVKNEVDSDDCSTLWQAVLKNRPDVIRKILKAASSELDGDLNTPLHASLLLAHDSCTDSLLKFRKELWNDINFKNKEGKTPLHIAAANGNLRHVKLLLECGANAGETETGTERNALHIAIIKRNEDIAKYLEEHCNVKTKTFGPQSEFELRVPLAVIPSNEAEEDRVCSLKDEKEGKSIETKSGDRMLSKINLDKLYETLNETESWRILADLLNCSYLIPSAEEAQNPAKCIFSCSEQVNGEIELGALRCLLDAINEQKGMTVLDEILAVTADD